jgi:hypothetical protein
MRYYSRNTNKPQFKTEVDKNNWYACHNAFKGYTDKDKAILVSVYSGYDTLADEVYNTAKKYQTNQNLIWDMMKEFERKVGKRRGLL